MTIAQTEPTSSVPPLERGPRTAGEPGAAGFLALASVGDQRLRAAAIHHSTLALARAERALSLRQDLDRIRAVARLVERKSASARARRYFLSSMASVQIFVSVGVIAPCGSTRAST